MPLNICRLCLLRAPFTLQLTEEAAKMLETLTSIKLTGVNDISTVCTKCCLNLKLAYTIQQNIIRANEKLSCLGHLLTRSQEQKDGNFDIYFNIQYESVCKICDISIDNNYLTTHVKSHFSCEQFCDLCNENFDNIQSYRTHVLQYHEQSWYKCNMCDLSFFYKSLYNVHLENAHPTSVMEDELPPCLDNVEGNLKQEFSENEDDTTEPSQTTTTVELKQEILNHDEEEALSQAQKQLKQEIIDHELEEIDSQLLINENCEQPDPLNTLTCDTCQKQFTDRKKFSNHRYNHKRRECPICKRQVVTSDFSKHVENHNYSPQACKVCGKIYNSKKKLRSHMTYKHGGKMFECDLCDVVYKSRQALNYHRRRHHTGAEHVCETCGREFLFASILKQHIMRIHQGLRPHVCDLCKKCFFGLRTLQKHQKIHMRETPYKCDICGQSFGLRLLLKAHKKTKHDYVEPLNFRCEICDKLFASQKAVTAHTRCHY